MSNTPRTTTAANPKKGLSLKNKIILTAVNIVAAAAYRSDGTVNRCLLNYADIHSPPSGNVIDGVSTFDHTVDLSRQLWFRLFVPVHQPSDHLPLIIYFHGGGFVHYSPSTTPFDTLCRRFAVDSHAVVISVNYRLAPENKYPAQYDDGFDIVKFVDSEVREKVASFPTAVDLGRCFLAGDSAGGNLAHHAAVRCGGFKFKEVRILGLVMIQPFFGGGVRTASETRLGNGGLLTLRHTDFFWKAFLPNGSDRNHPAVNVFGPESSEDFVVLSVEYPTSLVVVGGLDLLQDRQRSFVNGLKRRGKQVELVEYPNASHGFYGTSEFAEYEMLVAKMGDFVQKHMH